MVCSNGMMCGDMMNFKRKHTGSAGHDIVMQLSNQIKNGEKHYTRILNDRDALRGITLSNLQQSELLGRLFADDEIITPTQVSTIKKEMKKASFDYGCNDDNAWAFYNHVTHSLKVSPPRDWMQDSQDFHDFMMTQVVTAGPKSFSEVNINDFAITMDPEFDHKDIEHDVLEGVAIEIDQEITEGQLAFDTYSN